MKGGKVVIGKIQCWEEKKKKKEINKLLGQREGRIEVLLSM